MSALEQSPAVRALTTAERGVLLAVMAHFIWGGMALYFGLIRHVSPVEIAVHRGLWALPIAGFMIWYLGLGRDVLKVMSSPRKLAVLALTSGLIVFNWGFYVWSIEAGRTLESSLGYFINPLLNVVMGYLFLGERFTRPQIVALVLAAVAVLVQTIALGAFPWLGIMLAATFCLYGFLRKTIDVGPIQGFFVEVAIVALPLLLAQGWLARHSTVHFGVSGFETAMLIGCGVMTATTLMLYTSSVRHIRYSTTGLLQYISPSLVFLTAVFVFGEPLDHWKFASFVIIWIALAIFSVAAVRDERIRRRDMGQVSDPI